MRELLATRPERRKLTDPPSFTQHQLNPLASQTTSAPLPPPVNADDGVKLYHDPSFSCTQPLLLSFYPVF